MIHICTPILKRLNQKSLMPDPFSNTARCKYSSSPINQLTNFPKRKSREKSCL